MLSQAKYKKNTTSSSDISDLSLTDGSSNKEENIVVRANKKDKKTNKVQRKANQVKKEIKKNAPEPKVVAKKVKKQGKRVAKTAKENVTPENVGKIYNDPGEAINIMTDIITGKRLIPQSDKSKATEMTEKQKYNILVDHIKELEGTVNRCCEDKKLRSNIQFVDAESLFKKNLEDIKSKSKQKYVKVAEATARQAKRTVHRVDKNLKEGLFTVSPISSIIRRLVNPKDNVQAYEIIKSIMTHIRIGEDVDNLSPEQFMVIEDIRELIEYSNKHPDPHKKINNPPGLRLSDIVRLIFGYYIYNKDAGEVEAHISTDLVDGVPFGDLRYDNMKQEDFKGEFINMFHILFGIKKGAMRSTLNKEVLSQDIPDDRVVIQRLYDHGGKKNNKTFKKKKKNKKK